VTPAQWAVDRLIGDAAWIRAEVLREVSDEKAARVARRWLEGSAYSGSAGFVRGSPDGLRYSHPDGSVGRLSWDGVVVVLREMERELNPQEVLF